ncbi:MAG: TonB-dependent receptor, partial [Bacteroidaceae bacterium]|nr:TonB-dependent receptor [Bacteroidaceae bacterium]
MNTRLHFYILLLLLMLSHPVLADGCRIYGTVTSKEKECVPFATVGVEKSALGTNADGEGIYEIVLPEGEYVIYVSAMGYASRKMNVRLSENEALECNVELEPVATELDGIVVTETVSGVSRLRRSAYNAVAIDTKDFLNTTKNLADILSTTPGVKLRESGGVGSEMNIMMDGFSGRNVKIFIDGVPQEGVGSSFGVNNIPVNFAERVEVYRGVVPVEFGTDAMGGVVNIVTKKQREGWNVEASYSYGSFNTHRSFLNFNRTFNNGFTFEVNAFQNYSDNNYKVNVPVEDFVTGSIEKKKLHLVERFNDTYHNEALSMKLGVTGKKWADKLLFGVRLSQMYKDIQTGVRQEIVYGAKHRTSYSVMPSAEYSKKNLFVSGLDVAATFNYNRNAVTNVDTSMYKYNWLGETKLLNSPGEQSCQHTRSDNDNWNATLTVDYRPKRSHTH